jgi:protease I
MVRLVRDVFDRGGIVAFVCHGGWVPVSAGIVRGRKATSFFAIRDDMVNAGADWVDEEVVHDGQLISSRKPDDLPAFCRTLIKALS